MLSRRRFTSTLMLVALSAAVTACGRKGALDTPYEAAVEARRQAERRGEPLPPEPQRPVEDRPFILDSLL